MPSNDYEHLDRRRRQADAELADLRLAWPDWLLWTSDTGACYATRTPRIIPADLDGDLAVTVAANTPMELQRKLCAQLGMPAGAS